jgi:hemerythrin-like domain-containing protein
MQLFELIKSQHEEIKEILEEMAGSKSTQVKSREKLLDRLKKLLLPHHEAEEKYLFKILFEESDETVPLYEGIEEHRAVQFVLKDLEKTPADDDAWEGVCLVLKEMAEHHIEEEEDEIFDLAKEVIDSDRAKSIGERFEKIEKEQKKKMFA